MGHQVGKSRGHLIDKELRFNLKKETMKRYLYESHGTVSSLRDVPLEERKKEAEKPLFLTRYE